MLKFSTLFLIKEKKCENRDYSLNDDTRKKCKVSLHITSKIICGN